MIGWLIGSFLWHINLCRLFNTKSIFILLDFKEVLPIQVSINVSDWLKFKCVRHFKKLCIVNFWYKHCNIHISSTITVFYKHGNVHILNITMIGSLVKDVKNGTWYLLACLTLSNIKYVSREKWSNPGKGVAPSHTLQYSSNWKGSLLVALDYSRQLLYCKSIGLKYLIFTKWT